MHARVKFFIKVFSHYTDDPTKFAEIVQGVTKEVTRLGLSIIEEELESYDQLLRERRDLRRGWYIERRNETKLGDLADMPVYSIPYPQMYSAYCFPTISLPHQLSAALKNKNFSQ